jgi:hypothetical protein
MLGSRTIWRAGGGGKGGREEKRTGVEWMGE